MPNGWRVKGTQTSCGAAPNFQRYQQNMKLSLITLMSIYRNDHIVRFTSVKWYNTQIGYLTVVCTSCLEQPHTKENQQKLRTKNSRWMWNAIPKHQNTMNEKGGKKKSEANQWYKTQWLRHLCISMPVSSEALKLRRVSGRFHHTPSVWTQLPVR